MRDLDLDPDEIYRRMKIVPNAELLRANRDAMVRFSEHRVEAERRRLAERAERDAPVYNEMREVLRKMPELAGVMASIDSRGKTIRTKPHRLPIEKNPFAPTKPVVRLGSLHIVDAPPFAADTWTWQEGDSNRFLWGPAADGATGNMGFQMQPGATSAGHMACWAAVGVAAQVIDFNFPPALVVFTAVPSLGWSYREDSNWWREAAGNIWIGQWVGVFDQNGVFLNNPVSTQVPLASFDDRNFAGAGSDEASTSGMQLQSLMFFPPVGSIINYWCWTGASCNADGSNNQSFCSVDMQANCSNLIIDMIGL
jgi:hypothetical protein